MHFYRRNIILCVLKVAITAAYIATCPDQDAINPCECQDINGYRFSCSDKNMTLDSLKNALSAFKDQSIKSVQLNGLKLDAIPSNFFQGVKILSLEISNCELDSLSGGGGKPLQGLEQTLEVLQIKSSFKERDTPAKLIVSHLQRLKGIYLISNSINELGNEWFENAAPSLTTVSLRDNGIRLIGKRAFADIKNLEKLELTGNRFGSISRNMMPSPAEELDSLWFYNNGLRNLPDDIFTNMPYLKTVVLSNNGITVIPENVWKQVWSQLRSVNFDDNPMICDDDLYWTLRTPTCAKIKGNCKYPRRIRGKAIPYLLNKKCF